MFSGILLPLGQALVAAVVAIGLRANLPAALFATFVSNPLTTPLILLAVYRVGSAVLGQAGRQLMGQFDTKEQHRAPGTLFTHLKLAAS